MAAIKEPQIAAMLPELVRKITDAEEAYQLIYFNFLGASLSCLGFLSFRDVEDVREAIAWLILGPIPDRQTERN